MSEDLASAAAALGGGDGDGSSGENSQSLSSSVAEWAQELGSPETQAFIGTKGWQSPEAMVESYKQLETHMGGAPDSILKLKGIDDREAWHGDGGIYEKLGRPQKASEYELPAGLDEGLSTKFRDQAFGLGMTQTQAKELATWFAQEGSAGQEAQNLAQAANQRQELTQVQQEWGAQWEANIATAKAGMATLGIDSAMASAIEASVGTREMLQRMYNVGRMLHGAQHGVHGDHTNSPVMSSSEAEREIDRLKSDNEFMQRWAEGGKHELDKMRSLMKIARPGRGEGVASTLE